MVLKIGARQSRSDNYLGGHYNSQEKSRRKTSDTEEADLRIAVETG